MDKKKMSRIVLSQLKMENPLKQPTLTSMKVTDTYYGLAKWVSFRYLPSFIWDSNCMPLL
jgi:hypothetical protein